MDYLPTLSDSVAIFEPNNFTLDEIRSICFDVFIIDDLLYEDVESFIISLELDTFKAQSGIRVDPSFTEILILDNDGKGNLSFSDLYALRVHHMQCYHAFYLSCCRGSDCLYGPSIRVQ